MKPRPVKAWGWYNFGSALLGTERTRKRAIEAAEVRTGKPWAVCRTYIQVRKVIVTPTEEGK